MLWVVLAVANAGVGQCEDLWDEDPHDPSVWQCAVGAAQAGELDEALAFAERVQSIGPVTGQAQLTYGNLLMMARDDRALEALVDAADRFSAEGDLGGEVKTRLNLASEFRHRGDLEAGWDELQIAQAASGDSQPFAGMVRIEQARWICDVGGDYSQALRDLEAVRPRLSDDGFPSHGKLLIHHVSGCLADRLGRLEEAREHREALVAFTEETGNDMVRAVTLDNLLWTEALSESQRPNLAGRAADALTLATQVGHGPTIADLECLVAYLDPTATYTQCLALADEYELDAIRTRAYTLAADRAVTAHDRGAARRWLDVAGQSVVDNPSLESRIEYRASEARFADAFEPDLAIDAGEQALLAVEDLRSLQRDGLVRGRTVSQWAWLYDVQANRHRQVDDLGSAVATLERLRGRQVLERLDRAGATSQFRPQFLPYDEHAQFDADWAERDARLQTIDALRASGDDPETLAELERDDVSMRDALFVSVPAFGHLRTSNMEPTDFQSALQPHEAVVVHVAGEQPWAAVVRHDRMAAVDLPDLADAIDKAALFSALVAQGDALAQDSAEPLGEALMGPVLPELDGVAHLILVPDASLYRMAWSELAPAGRSLGDEYALSFAPSIRSLMYARTLTTAEDANAIVAATPAVSGGPVGFRSGESLGPLPHAEDEAKAAISHLSHPAILWLDEQATETKVRDAAAGDVRLLHLAAHAVVDPIDPGRSAVVLGADDEQDGRLQVREVAGMNLSGAIVVLSACRTADGEVHSEGVVGLADGFLQAGARAVVASLWPLSDAAASEIMDTLHAELATGVRLDDALAVATRSRTEAAGLRLIGDGSVTLPGRRSRYLWAWFVLGAAALLVAAGVVIGRRR